MEMNRVENQELLTQRFGRWPSFHDAEVISARFQRGGPDAPCMECDIHIFQSTDEVDARGYYVRRNHTLVTLRFCHVELEYFQEWNNQNSLWDLTMTEAPSGDAAGEGPRVEVRLESNYGCSAHLTCDKVKILRAEDFRVE